MTAVSERYFMCTLCGSFAAETEETDGTLTLEHDGQTTTLLCCADCDGDLQDVEAIVGWIDLYSLILLRADVIEGSEKRTWADSLAVLDGATHSPAAVRVAAQIAEIAEDRRQVARRSRLTVMRGGLDPKGGVS